MQAHRQAVRSADWTAGWLECRQARRPTGKRVYTHGQICLQVSLKEVLSLIPVLLLGSLGIKKDAIEAGITVQSPIRLLTDYCFHEKAARKQQGMF